MRCSFGPLAGVGRAAVDWRSPFFLRPPRRRSRQNSLCCGDPTDERRSLSAIRVGEPHSIGGLFVMRRLSMIAFFFAAVFTGASIGCYLRAWYLQSTYRDSGTNGSMPVDDALRVASSNAKWSGDKFVVFALLSSNLGFAFLAKSLSSSTKPSSPFSEPLEFESLRGPTHSVFQHHPNIKAGE
jgi:hypothetical protein